MKISKKIDTGKLKVKYVLGIHSSLKGYPTPEDILYELIRDYSVKVANEIKFTDANLQKRYSLSEERLHEIIQHLESKGFLEVINQTSSYKTYQVIKNPYS